MARRRKLNWQFEAQQDRKEIFQYQNKKNKSKEYSKRLNQLFRTKTEALKDFPYNGHTTNLENVRVLVIEKYLIVYEIFEQEVLISRIWDGRRNPEILKLK